MCTILILQNEQQEMGRNTKKSTIFCFDNESIPWLVYIDQIYSFVVYLLDGV